MTYELIASQPVKSTVTLPASKSISNRALILNALSYSPHTPQNLSDCDDTRVMVEAFDSAGNKFDIGAAGTSMRFLTAFLSKIGGVWEITGSERMKNRPIGILVEALRTLGAQIEYLEKEGFPPLRITGRALRGGDLEMNGNVSSQFISAILMIAPTMRDGLTLRLKGEIISTPYIKMTLGMMAEFGIRSEWEGNTIRIEPQDYKEIPYVVESDWSAASYWYEIASLAPGSDIFLKGLREESLQGDSAIAGFFKPLGVETEYLADGVRLTSKESTCGRYELDLTDQPDLAQTLVVTCALKGIPFKITGLQTLKIKETDRILALKQELAKLGYLVTDSEDRILEWNGERTTVTAEPAIDTYEDHRMAMAFAPAALAYGPIRINEPKVVSKSYPSFWKDLKEAGFEIIEK